MSLAIVIPARYASSRLPRKLLLNATGKPLLCHTIDAAYQAMQASDGLIDQIVVATDHDDILQLVQAQGYGSSIRAMMTDVNHASGSDRVAEVAATVPATVEGIINVQGDEPEIEPAAVLALARCLVDGTAPMATLAYPIRDAAAIGDPNLVKVVCDQFGHALYFSRAPIPYDRDGSAGVAALGHVGMYGYRLETLRAFVQLPEGALERVERLEQLRALENGIAIRVHILTDQPAKGIDTQADYDAFVARVASV